MKYQTILECACRHETSLTEGEGETIVQCSRCLNLESHIVDTIYTYHCLGCGFEEKIEGDVSFPESKTCTNCALSGMIDGAGIDPIALFEITSRAEVKSNCKACKGGVWHDGEDGFTCPSCRSKKLKSKMGALWDPSEESKQE